MRWKITTPDGTDVGDFDGLYDLEALANFFNERGFGPVVLDRETGELVWKEGSKPSLAAPREAWEITRLI